MKRVVLLIIAVIFSASISAQTMPSVKTDDIKDAGMAVAAEENPDVEKQIKEALMKDEGLQKETINYLKENPETTSAVSKILEDNKGSVDGIMKSVLGDSALSTAAIDWISNNPEMLQKAMKIVGM